MPINMILFWIILFLCVVPISSLLMADAILGFYVPYTLDKNYTPDRKIVVDSASWGGTESPIEIVRSNWESFRTGFLREWNK